MLYCLAQNIQYEYQLTIYTYASPIECQRNILNNISLACGCPQVSAFDQTPSLFADVLYGQPVAVSTLDSLLCILTSLRYNEELPVCALDIYWDKCIKIFRLVMF